MALSVEDEIWLDQLSNRVSYAGWEEQINNNGIIKFGRGGQMKDEEIMLISRELIQINKRSNIRQWEYDTIFLLKNRLSIQQSVSILTLVGLI